LRARASHRGRRAEGIGRPWLDRCASGLSRAIWQAGRAAAAVLRSPYSSPSSAGGQARIAGRPTTDDRRPTTNDQGQNPNHKGTKTRSPNRKQSDEPRPIQTICGICVPSAASAFPSPTLADEGRTTNDQGRKLNHEGAKIRNSNTICSMCWRMLAARS
jgi:hypothetical protein